MMESNKELMYLINLDGFNKSKIKIEIIYNGKKIKREFDGNEKTFEAFIEEIDKQIRIFQSLGNFQSLPNGSEMNEDGKKQYIEGWK